VPSAKQGPNLIELNCNIDSTSTFGTPEMKNLSANLPNLQKPQHQHAGKSSFPPNHPLSFSLHEKNTTRRNVPLAAIARNLAIPQGQNTPFPRPDLMRCVASCTGRLQYATAPKVFFP
jgi:hypothetical protein